jgi:hypothetical protein
MTLESSYLFRLAYSSYITTHRRGWLWCVGYLVCAGLALVASLLILPTYTHIWTPYLKWQDALVALLWFITLLSCGGATFILRFLRALHAGYSNGVLHLMKDHSLAVRDLSHENFKSIFWMMHTALWCFIAVLVGLSPEILLRWTLHLSHPLLAVLATGLVGLLSLAGLVVSAVLSFFIIVGSIGLVKACRTLGALHTYKLDNRITIRLDGSLLTVIYPDKPESMLDLTSLIPEDRQRLLALLDECEANVYVQGTADEKQEVEQGIVLV